MFKKIFYSLFTLVVILSAFAMGCAAPVSGEDIANRTLSAAQQVNSVKMDGQFVVDASSTGAASFSVSATDNVTAEVNVAAKEMHATGTAVVALPFLGNVTVSTESFLQGGWLYTGIDTGSGKTWQKSPVDSTAWQSQDQLQQQLAILESAVQVNKLGTETVDGVECYVLEIKPDLNALTALLKSQDFSAVPGISGFDVSKLDLARMITTLELKQWVAIDSYLLKKTDIKIGLALSPQDLAPTVTGSNQVTASLKATVNFHDYNQPVGITVPPEALAAPQAAEKP